MEQIKTNAECLNHYLEELKTASDFSAILINSKGVRFHMLKEYNRLYCLLVPNLPVDDLKNAQLIKAGFHEKFPKINYEMEFGLENKTLIIEKTLLAMNQILQIEIGRIWRFEINPGMMVIRANEAELPTGIRREKKLLKNRSIPRRLFKFILSKTGFAILAAIMVFLLQFKLSDDLKISIILGIITFPAFLLVIKIKEVLNTFFKTLFD